MVGAERPNIWMKLRLILYLLISKIGRGRYFARTLVIADGIQQVRNHEKMLKIEQTFFPFFLGISLAKSQQLLLVDS